MMNDFDLQQQQLLERRKRYLEQSQYQSPQGQMVSGHYVAPNAFQHIASALRAYGGIKGEQQTGKELEGLGQKRRDADTADVDSFIGALRGTAARQIQPITPNDDEGNVNQPMQVDAVAPDRNKALALALRSQNPMLQQSGAQMLNQESMPKNVVVGRSLMNQNTGQIIGSDATWAGEQQAAREAKQAELTAKMEDARTSRAEKADLARELQQSRLDSQRELRTLASSMRQPPAVTLATIADPKDPSKSIIVDARTGNLIGAAAGDKNAKLPTSALKLQQEEVDAIGTAGSIIADTNALIKQIDRKDLQLGPVKNATSAVRNAVGLSSDNSQNYAAFKSSLEKLRNDSLRLNKGVQTEGDATRELNALIAGINDPNVVKRQLTRINEINQRAVDLRRMNIDSIRGNFGVAPMDTQKQSNQAPALGEPAAPGMPQGFKVIR